MKKLLNKWWFWLILILLIIGGVLLYNYLKFFKNLKFQFKLGGNLGNILSGLQSARGFGFHVDAPIKTVIDNLNKVGIDLTDVFFKVSYDGEDVLRTKPESAVLSSVKIPANTTGFEINDVVEIIVNPSSIKLIGELIKNQKANVLITLRSKVFGIASERKFPHSLDFQQS